MESRSTGGRRADRLDAWLWGLLGLLLLIALPVGRVTPDGLAQARKAETGVWRLDPNHLVLEPLDALWLEATRALFPARPAADRLRLLAALAGAAAVALFRARLAPRLAASRAAANYATTWLAFGAGFLQLWVSAECFMLQLPPVVAAAVLLLRLRHDLRPSRAFGLGAAIGAATLVIASCVLMAPFALLALAWPAAEGAPRRGRRRAAGWILGGLAAVGLPALASAWWVEGRRVGAGVIDWVLAYGGGAGLGRLRAAYGAQLSLPGLARAALRAAYGAASVPVDLSPAVAAWRDAHRVVLPAAIALAAIAAAVALAPALRRRDDARGELLALALFLAPPVLLFGWLWDNSEGQFYAPLAVLVGAAAACAWPRSRRAAALGLLVLGWNLVDLSSRYVLYPRGERLAELARVSAGACAVVYPGFDEIEVLWGLADPPPAGRPLSLTSLAVASPAPEGLERLAAVAADCLREGGTVVVLDLYDRPPYEPPWKFLRAMGYRPEEVRAALAGLPFEGPARTVGPWSVRTARAGAAGRASPGASPAPRRSSATGGPA